MAESERFIMEQFSFAGMELVGVPLDVSPLEEGLRNQTLEAFPFKRVDFSFGDKLVQEVVLYKGGRGIVFDNDDFMVNEMRNILKKAVLDRAYPCCKTTPEDIVLIDDRIIWFVDRLVILAGNPSNNVFYSSAVAVNLPDWQLLRDYFKDPLAFDLNKLPKNPFLISEPISDNECEFIKNKLLEDGGRHPDWSEIYPGQ